ncbi:hypothetical protein K439DRAFT_1636576, partial [Ramaria rubella]
MLWLATTTVDASNTHLGPVLRPHLIYVLVSQRRDIYPTLEFGTFRQTRVVSVDCRS